MNSSSSPITINSNVDIPPCLAVVVPVYNEENTIAAILDVILEQHPVMEVIVVDDGSNDKTYEIVCQKAEKDLRIKLFKLDYNQGKGAALRTGFMNVSAPYVIIQDADLEYDPTEYYMLLKPVLMNKADVVYGSRFLGFGTHRVLYYWHSLGNHFLTMLSNMATNLNLTDMETCYKLFRKEVLDKIKIEENRFGFEPEITAKVSKLNLRIYEVPISYYGRTYDEGKKIGWKDGVYAFLCILKYNFFK